MIDWFISGGPVMYPLLLVSVVAMAIILERLWVLRRSVYLDDATVNAVTQLVVTRDYTGTLDYCHRRSGPFPALVSSLIENRNAPYDELKEILEDKGRHELLGLQRGLPALATIVAGAPLLGLLGTVTGMIKIFAAVASSGTGITEKLSAGIAEALITTEAGLFIAIPALFVHAYLESRAVTILADVEARLLDTLHLVRRPKPAREE
jgi:biopolymer transport protein ExbB